MFQEISYYLIFGKPLIMYMGIALFILLGSTATIGYLIHHGKAIPFKYHKACAASTIALGIVHAILGMGLFF